MITSRISIFVTALRRSKQINSLFLDLEFPRGMGDQVEKIMEIPGGMGSNGRPSGTKNPVGWGDKLEKTLCGAGGYGYFLEPHIFSIKLFLLAKSMALIAAFFPFIRMTSKDFTNWESTSKHHCLLCLPRALI